MQQAVFLMVKAVFFNVDYFHDTFGVNSSTSTAEVARHYLPMVILEKLLFSLQ